MTSLSGSHVNLLGIGQEKGWPVVRNNSLNPSLEGVSDGTPKLGPFLTLSYLIT